jgi:hypothetical protein
LLHSLGLLGCLFLILGASSIRILIIILAMAFESLHLLRLSNFPATGLSVNPPVRLCRWLVIKKLLSFILVEPIIVIIKVVSRCRLLGCSGLR